MTIGTGEDLGPDYETVEFSCSYFLEEYHRFRAIMGSTNNTIEDMDAAFNGLSYVYLNMKEDDPKAQLCIDAFVRLIEEFSRRKAYLIVKKIDF